MVVSLGFLYLLRSKEEHTTLTAERAIHAPAAHGGNMIPREQCRLEARPKTPQQIKNFPTKKRPHLL